MPSFASISRLRVNLNIAKRVARGSAPFILNRTRAWGVTGAIIGAGYGAVDQLWGGNQSVLGGAFQGAFYGAVAGMGTSAQNRFSAAYNRGPTLRAGMVAGAARGAARARGQFKFGFFSDPLKGSLSPGWA